MLCCVLLLEDSRDQADFQELYEANERLIWHMTGHFFSDEAKRWDAFQETWMKAARHFKKISSLACENQAAYLVIIVKNVCRSLLKSEGRYAQLPEDPAELEAMVGGAEDPGMDGAAFDANRAVELIAELPDAYRMVLECRLVLGMSNGEIAQRLGITTGKASTWFTRGKALLIKRLREEGICYE